jgi:hypothetical protein
MTCAAAVGKAGTRQRINPTFPPTIRWLFFESTQVSLQQR